MVSVEQQFELDKCDFKLAWKSSNDLRLEYSNIVSKHIESLQAH